MSESAPDTSLQTCRLCGIPCDGITRPGLVALCRDCMQSEPVQELLTDATECFEEYRPTFGIRILRAVYTWLALAGTGAVALTAVVNIIWIVGLVGGMMAFPPDIDGVLRYAATNLLFFGFSFCFISVIAIPMALITLFSGHKRIRYEVDTKQFVTESGTWKTVVPLEGAHWVTGKWFCADGLGFQIPNRRRVNIGYDRNWVTCGHTDESYLRWTRLLYLLGLTPPSKRKSPLWMIAVLVCGVLAGLLCGVVFGTLLALALAQAKLFVPITLLGAFDGLFAGVLILVRVTYPEHFWQHQKYWFTGAGAGLLLGLKCSAGLVPMSQAFAVSSVNAIIMLTVVRCTAKSDAASSEEDGIASVDEVQASG